MRFQTSKLAQSWRRKRAGFGITEYSLLLFLGSFVVITTVTHLGDVLRGTNAISANALAGIEGSQEAGAEDGQDQNSLGQSQAALTGQASDQDSDEWTAAELAEAVRIYNRMHPTEEPGESDGWRIVPVAYVVEENAPAVPATPEEEKKSVKELSVSGRAALKTTVDEGTVPRVYLDYGTKGNLTVGIGHFLGKPGSEADTVKVDGKDIRLWKEGTDVSVLRQKVADRTDLEWKERYRIPRGRTLSEKEQKDKAELDAWLAENTTSLTNEQIAGLYKQDLKVAEDDVKRYVKVSLTQSQFDALTDYAYNKGGPAFNSSAAVKALNEKRYQDVPKAILDDAKGPNGEDLLGRRESEVRTWNGDYRTQREIDAENKKPKAPVVAKTSQV